ncbi:MAG: DNA gyrase inhibitor YacG [Proteobacteria bacterium]|nr:DNA gyrase inhibitor YacG [Pseudomonadota bacterium]MBS0572776.1 DNA gyrase inhibitor YacG [Pseudomonadota bacterium]
MACPICHKDSDPKYRPFCSRRCADIDLGRWLSGSYVLPGDEASSPGDPAADHPAPPAPRRH